MKTRSDPRHVARTKRMSKLFSYDFKDREKTNSDIAKIVKNISRIDDTIAQSAPAFPVTKIAKVDLAILRLAVYELLFEKKAPPKVIIDEAVELAKEFGGETSSSFVNGALGSVLEKTYGSKNN